MFRTMLIGAALGATFLANPTVLLGQPPSPPEVVRKIDRGVKRALTRTDHAVGHAVHRSHHVRTVARRTVHSRVRALCHDGRVHIGRTRVTACAGHGGVKG
jgi:hypothetical protein